MNYKGMTKRQFLNGPLPEIRESEESKLCRKTGEAILNKNNEEFLKCINSPDFDINERFDTSYIQRENYLGYALYFGNYFAANEILKFKELKLTDLDMQNILQTLTLHRKYIKLFNIIKKQEGTVSFPRYINAVATLDYNKVKKRAI